MWPLDDSNRNNILKTRFNINIVVNPRLTGNSWFLASKKDMEIYYWDRAALELKSEGDFATTDSSFSVWCRFGCGAYSGKGIIGNEGA